MSSKKCQSTKVAGPDRKLQRDSRLDCREAARKLKGAADRLQARLQRGCYGAGRICSGQDVWTSPPIIWVFVAGLLVTLIKTQTSGRD